LKKTAIDSFFIFTVTTSRRFTQLPSLPDPGKRGSFTLARTWFKR